MLQPGTLTIPSTARQVFGHVNKLQRSVKFVEITSVSRKYLREAQRVCCHPFNITWHGGVKLVVQKVVSLLPGFTLKVYVVFQNGTARNTGGPSSL